MFVCMCGNNDNYHLKQLCISEIFEFSNAIVDVNGINCRVKQGGREGGAVKCVCRQVCKCSVSIDCNNSKQLHGGRKGVQTDRQTEE